MATEMSTRYIISVKNNVSEMFLSNSTETFDTFFWDNFLNYT